MKGGLWFVRLLLLVGVSAVVLSPLVVHGEDAAPQPFEWRYDASELMLPSSPLYPAVAVARDARMSFAERSIDKAELSLSYANQDAADIVALVQREYFLEAVNHSGTFKLDFERCLDWLALANERGSDVSLLLEHVKNDHLGQQVALSEAFDQLPKWAMEGAALTRQQVTDELLNTIQTLQGREFADEYVRLLNSVGCPVDSEAWGTEVSQPLAGQQTTEEQFDEQTVAPVVAAAEEEESPAVVVAVYSMPPNIISLRVEPDDVMIGEECTVSCSVESRDSSSLSFSWWCSNGDLTADGSEATWTLPDEEGRYEIEVTVTDELGQSDSRSLKIKVDDPEGEDAPASTGPDVLEIVGMTATAEHKYFEESMVGYSILVSRSCEIVCDVADSDGVEFEWRCSSGDIEGSGSTIIWSAPSSPTNSTVTVTISDGYGNEESMTLAFHVTTCTVCFA
ncbi:MAG: hypothetical protein JW846_02470 [Dehalococcoidia bacterium]|nr:hypothetical protein [Dehalococcoidia bacterium]